MITQSQLGDELRVEGPNPHVPVQVVAFVQVIHGYTQAVQTIAEVSQKLVSQAVQIFPSVQAVQLEVHQLQVLQRPVFK